MAQRKAPIMGKVSLLLAIATALASVSQEACAAPYQVYELRNVRATRQISRVAQGVAVSGFSNQLPGGVLTLSTTRRVKHEFSLGVGVTVRQVSASLGYNISAEQEVRYQYQTRPIPRGKRVLIQAYNVYQVYEYDIWMTPAFGNPSQAQKVGSGNTLRFLRPDYVESIIP